MARADKPASFARCRRENLAVMDFSRQALFGVRLSGKARSYHGSI
jgi:hypothetical protein